MQLWSGWRLPGLRRGAARRSAPPARPLVAGAAVVLVGVMLLTAWLLWDARRVAWEHAAQSSENVASTIEHDITHTIELYDLSLQAVVNSLRLPGIGALTPTMRNEVLFDHAATARFLGPIKVLDEAGRVKVDSQNLSPPEQDFADRAFFRTQREQPRLGLFVGAPFKNPRTGLWSIPLSRRLDHPDGSFAGVVVGTLRLDFFNYLFSLVDRGAGGTLALFRADGRLIDRVPYDENLVGHKFGKFALFRHYPQAKSGVFTATSIIDGVERLFAYRQIGDLPLVLTVGTARETVLAQWWQKAIVIAIVIFALAALAIGLGLALLHELRRRDLAERTALDNEQRYRLLAEHSGDMIVRFDPQTQRRSYVSPACRALYGYEPEEALAMSAEQVIHPDDFPGVCEAVARVERERDHPPIVYRGKHKDGSYIWVEASLTRSPNPQTGAEEIISVVRDVGERIRYEAALRLAKDEADSANRSKSQFLATMSHELRTPLNAIIGFAELMQREVMGPIGNEQYRSYINDINVSGSHLLELINDILDLTKAEAGMLELHDEVMDLSAAIRAVARASRAQIEKAELEVDVDLSADLPLLRADERKVRQVFFNLIGNAVKFTLPGGRIRIVGRFDPKSGTTVTVADSGIGIAPADLERVLEPFVQVDSTLARRHHGTGLGLPAVKAIMNLHGGTVSLRSSVGVGTEVIIAFPAERTVAPPPTEPARSAA
ncbi:MAG TPA: ATP-binding protein [Stellaceae bacterium]|nr:ATP-binding protein [Stellaceae bacterium]